MAAIKGTNLRAEVKTITSQVAELFLKTNKTALNNRSISSARVARYAAAMVAGEWTSSGDRSEAFPEAI